MSIDMAKYEAYNEKLDTTEITLFKMVLPCITRYRVEFCDAIALRKRQSKERGKNKRKKQFLLAKKIRSICEVNKVLLIKKGNKHIIFKDGELIEKQFIPDPFDELMIKQGIA